MPVSTLPKMELAQVSVSYEKLAAAARALNVDIAQLFRASAYSQRAGTCDRGGRSCCLRPRGTPPAPMTITPLLATSLSGA